MIGQQQLLSDIANIKDNFPRFSIIVGGKGCGKKTICKEIVKTLGLTPIYHGSKIEDVRTAIDQAYTQLDPIAYVFADADNMSVAAKNSLLKVTEEPPKNAYFIMTLQSPDNTLQTIRSRGTVFTLNNYSVQELLQYRLFKGYSNTNDEVITKFCTTTGEVDELFSYDVDKFNKFVQCVADNIHIPTNGNTFKITNYFKLKDTDEGFDCILLLKAIRQEFLNKGKLTNKPQYLKAAIETSKSIAKLNNTVVNKLGIIDMWIFNVRVALQGV